MLEIDHSQKRSGGKYINIQGIDNIPYCMVCLGARFHKLERIEMRKSKKDWFVAGLGILAEFGLPGLTIEKLTRVLAVTKGSFYHHFHNVEEFQAQLIAYWGEQYLSTSINLPDDPNELRLLLDTIMEESFGGVTGPEMTIRVWAQQDETVRSVVEQVDTVRHKFVFTVFRSVVKDDVTARLMTDIMSAMLVGSMMVLPPMTPDRVKELYQEFKRLYRLWDG